MKKIIILVLFGASAIIVYRSIEKNFTLNSDLKFGDAIDSLNHVIVFYNGSISTVKGRTIAKNGYNIGLKYQCVEFVKRYYFQHYNHQMPNPYGHAKDFFNKDLKDGQLNADRNLIQYSNGSRAKPRIGNLVVFGSSLMNSYGHVAIISNVSEKSVEIIQQNGGKYNSSRITFDLNFQNEKWTIDSEKMNGWLSLN